VIGLSGLPRFVTTFRAVGCSIAETRPRRPMSTITGSRPTVSLWMWVRAWIGTLVGHAAVSPRIAAAWAPMADGRTKLTRATPFCAIQQPCTFSKPLDQQAVTTPYDSSGTPLAPFVTTFLSGATSGSRVMASGAPARHATWDAAFRRARVDAQTRRRRLRLRSRRRARPGESRSGRHGLGYGGDYVLSNLRRDAYDEVALTVRQSFGEHSVGWPVTPVREPPPMPCSPPLSTSRAVMSLSPHALDAPIVPRLGLLSAARLELGVGSAGRLSHRTTVFRHHGFRRGGGLLNAQRYPDTFDLNVHVERRFVFHGYRLGLRWAATTSPGTGTMRR